MKLGVSGLVGALAVATGAFGAHALKHILTPDALAVWNTGAHYHLIHAVLLVVLALQGGTDRGLDRAWSMLLAGIVLFSGSLYVLAWSGIRILGAITPFGGLLLIAGWLQLGWAGWLARKKSRR
jgi:uncharacterized membrane protein YgdD (TMEM256/DUF423 family)